MIGATNLRMRIAVSSMAFLHLCAVRALADVQSIRPGELPQAGTGPAASVIATVSLSQDSYMVGEPIEATLIVYNYSEREIYLHGLGDAERGDIDMDLRDDAGRREAPRRFWGVGAQPKPLVAAAIDSRYKLVHGFVVSRWVAPTRPGRYELLITLRLRYCHFGETPRVETPLTSTYRIPVEVTRADMSRLAAVARRLHPIRWENNSAGDYQSLMFDMFTSVSGKAAAPMWLDALLHPHWMLNRSSLIFRLASIGDRAAIDTLATVWLTAAKERRDVARAAALGRAVLPDSDLEQAGQDARDALSSLYTRGDSRLKSYVGAIFRSEEGSVPALPRGSGKVRVQDSDGPMNPSTPTRH